MLCLRLFTLSVVRCCFFFCILHGPSMFAVKAKIYVVSAEKLLISQLFIGHYVVKWFPLVSIS